MTTTLVARGAQTHQALLVGQLSPYRPEFQQYLKSAAGMLSQYSDPASANGKLTSCFTGRCNSSPASSPMWIRFAGWRCYACAAPLVFLFRKTKARKGPIAAH